MDLNKADSYGNILLRMIKVAVKFISYISLLWYFQTLLLLVDLLLIGKKQILLRYVRRKIKEYCQNIDFYLFCLHAVKFLKSLLWTKFYNFFEYEICYLSINQDLFWWFMYLWATWTTCVDTHDIFLVLTVRGGSRAVATSRSALW